MTVWMPTALCTQDRKISPAESPMSGIELGQRAHLGSDLLGQRGDRLGRVETGDLPERCAGQIVRHPQRRKNVQRSLPVRPVGGPQVPGEQIRQAAVDTRRSVQRLGRLEQVGDVVLVEQRHHPRRQLRRKPVIGQHLSVDLDVTAGRRDKAVEVGEHGRENHRPRASGAEEHPCVRPPAPPAPRRRARPARPRGRRRCRRSRGRPVDGPGVYHHQHPTGVTRTACRTKW